MAGTQERTRVLQLLVKARGETASPPLNFQFFYHPDPERSRRGGTCILPERAQIYKSFLAFMPEIAGAFGGLIGRGVVYNLFAGK